MTSHDTQSAVVECPCMTLFVKDCLHKYCTVAQLDESGVKLTVTE